ncbi:hypothetical protein DRE_00229 [Drechslerella stenobrocha 248]|uniref:Uncharacterized protein n=1 Tax=Drechslerella stenobrocha 248 TaxID=1043628 RepID=W7HZI2_9PEZI|nr:hypothetical protein DRE_00229 [Drechslerella stenobrocha 248]
MPRLAATWRYPTRIDYEVDHGASNHVEEGVSIIEMLPEIDIEAIHACQQDATGWSVDPRELEGFLKRHTAYRLSRSGQPADRHLRSLIFGASRFCGEDANPQVFQSYDGTWADSGSEAKTEPFLAEPKHSYGTQSEPTKTMAPETDPGNPQLAWNRAPGSGL